MSTFGDPLELHTSARTPRGRRPQIGLSWLLTLYVGATLIVLLIGFTWFSLQAIHKAQNEAFSQQIHLTSTFAAGLEREFSHVSSDVQTYLPQVPSPTMSAIALDSLYHHLATPENLGYFLVTSVRVVDVDGRVLGVAPTNASHLQETLPETTVIQQALAEGVAVIAPSRHALEGQQPFAALVVPLLAAPGSNAEATLVVDTTGFGDIDLFSFARETVPEGITETEDAQDPYEMEVLGADGIILATSEGYDQLGTTSYHYEIMNEFFVSREAGAIVHRPDGDHPSHIAAIVPLGSTSFFLVTEEPLGLLLDWPQQLRTQAIILGSTAVFSILALGWILSQQIIRPLIALRRATTLIRGGNLETPVKIRAQGELAQLVEEVEAMRERLQETVTSLDGLNRSLTDQVQERTDQLRSVVSRLMQAQEEERHRIARDLHDETAQGLVALGVILDEAVLNVGRNDDKALESIGLARQEVNRLVADTRRLAYALRPSVLDDAGLVSALRWCAEAYLESNGVQVSLEASSPELRLPEPVEVALFRVGQEAMSNIARHAQARQAQVVLEYHGGWAALTIRDNGIGFDERRLTGQNGSPQFRGLGLPGMKERIDLLGGRFYVSSQPGQGTTVTAYVPTGRWNEEKA